MLSLVSLPMKLVLLGLWFVVTPFVTITRLTLWHVVILIQLPRHRLKLVEDCSRLCRMKALTLPDKVNVLMGKISLYIRSTVRRCRVYLLVGKLVRGTARLPTRMDGTSVHVRPGCDCVNVRCWCDVTCCRSCTCPLCGDAC